MTAPARPGALVLGEALVDVVRRADGTVSRRPGGSPANVAVALARLGRPVRLGSCWAPDADGALLAAHLAASGVETAGDPLTLTRTATAVAEIGADGSADYAFDIAWRPDAPGEVDALVVCVGSLGAVLSPGAEVVERAVRRLRERATVVYDLNVRPAITGVGPEVVGRMLMLAGLADVVKASEEDLAALWPRRPALPSAWALLACGPAAVVLTRGADGVTVLGERRELAVPALEAEVVDTIGAGDTLGAGLVDGLWSLGVLGGPQRAALRGLDDAAWTRVAAWASRCAAVTVGRAGADPPWRSELV